MRREGMLLPLAQRLAVWNGPVFLPGWTGDFLLVFDALVVKAALSSQAPFQLPQNSQNSLPHPPQSLSIWGRDCLPAVHRELLPTQS